jgi:hypothetical protein
MSIAEKMAYLINLGDMAAFLDRFWETSSAVGIPSRAGAVPSMGAWAWRR